MNFFPPLGMNLSFGCFLYSLQLNHHFLVALISLSVGPVPYGCCGMGVQGRNQLLILIILTPARAAPLIPEIFRGITAAG